MKHLIFVASWIFSLPAFASEPCTIGAAQVASALSKIQLRAEKFAQGELTLRVQGIPECAYGLEFDIEMDQAAARGLKFAPAAGAVLFARAKLEQDRLYVRLSGTKEVVEGLAEQMQIDGNLRRFIKAVTLRWMAYYSSTVVINQPFEIGDLAADCTRGVKAEMTCEAFRPLKFTTVPQCLGLTKNLARLMAGFEVEDPFLNGSENRVRIWGVAHSLCDSRMKRVPWVLAAGDTIIFGPRQLYDRKEVTVLSSIHVKGEIQW